MAEQIDYDDPFDPASTLTQITKWLKMSGETLIDPESQSIEQGC